MATVTTSISMDPRLFLRMEEHVVKPNTISRWISDVIEKELDEIEKADTGCDEPVTA